MQLLMIRHSYAAEPGTVIGGDFERPLTERGQQVFSHMAMWLAARGMVPERILHSPLVRARQTAEILCEAGALANGPAPPIVDERLREREFGIFDRLTTLGIRERFPEESAHRRRLGKFYHRPPGGESWADVILRLRSMLNTINLHFCDGRVLIICHQVVVLCFRYILEELDEQAILGIDKQAEVLNCGIAAYDFAPDAQGMCISERALWNYGVPFEEEGTAKTSEPDAVLGTR